MVSQDERTRATCDALVQAGRELFAERGYAEVSVAEIAARAGVTTGALYHQFGSKEGLFKAVYGELVQGVGTKVLEARAAVESPSLRGDCDAFLDACAAPELNRITIDGPVVIGWDEILDEAEAMIAVSLRDARDRGEIGDFPLDSLARMLAAALKEAAVMIARAEDPDAAREAARRSARQLLAGLSSES